MTNIQSLRSVVLALGALLLTACAPAIPPTPVITEEVVVVTPTPTLRSFEEFVFGDREKVAFTYDALLWQHHYTETLRTIDNFLQSKELASCRIHDVGATEIGPYETTPDAVKMVEAGQFHYKTWIFSFADSTPKFVEGWYLEQGGLADYSYTNSIGPLVQIHANSDEWQQCEQEALPMLGTLHSVKK